LAYIQFLGAAGTVTGSKHLVNVSGDESGRRGFQVLIDCGLFQGPKQWRVRNWEPLPVPAAEVDAVILTHAHLDHSGWLPRLVKQGFRGAIYATQPTIDLCRILLPDSGYLQEEDAAFHNQRKSSKHSPALPLYTMEEARQALAYLRPVPFEQTIQLRPELCFRFVRAGHILGSAMAEVLIRNGSRAVRVLFTGDIGRVHDSEVAPGRVEPSGPAPGSAADILVMESTYGNRSHPRNDVRPELARLVRETVARGGSVIVPAFAVERTQKFLFLLKELMELGEAPRVPVFSDSPMAIEAMKVFLEHSEELSESTRLLIRRYGSPLTWEGFTFAEKSEDSRKINDVRFPCIIVSSSGMVTGGRILHHLMRRLQDPRNLILFIGFQAPGTRGASIKEGARAVKMFGEEIPIRAQVAALEQFSDHADTPELLEWLRTFPQAPAITYLVHGEPEASETLREAITRDLKWQVATAEYLQKVPIASAAREESQRAMRG
jgi:metallo-beta-lactamase family protein